MFYKQIIKGMGNRGRKSIFLSFLINTVIISFFVMIILGVDNIANDKLSTSNTDQVNAVLSFMGMIGIVTIIFLQWIVYSLYNALLESRKNFYNTLRMLGTRSSKIFSVYFLEFSLLQLMTVPFSVILSYLFYNGIVSYYGFDSTIEIKYIISACVLNYIISLFSLIKSYKGNSSYNRYQKTEKYRFKKGNINLSRIRLLFSLVAMILAIYLLLTNDKLFLVVLALSIALIILLDEIIFGVCIILSKLLPNKYHIVINLIKGYFKDIKIISFTIILGLVLTFGISAFITTGREAAYSLVMDNIHYDKALQIEDFKYVEDKDLENEEISTAIVNIENKTSSGVMPVMAIKEDYIDNFENIEFVYNPQAKEAFKKNLNNPNYNGIIVKNTYISEEDIGTTMTLEMEGKKIDFEIIDGYYVSDFSTMFNFVSKSYVEAQLNMKDVFNIAYVKGSSEEYLKDIEKTNDIIIRNKNDLAKESSTKVIQGTFFVEIASYIILLSSFFMLANFIYLSTGKNKVDIARMRSFGMSGKSITVTYISMYICIVLIPIIISIFMSNSFGTFLTDSGLGSNFIKNGLTFHWGMFSLVFSLYVLFIIVIYLLVSNKTIKNYLELIRMKNNDI